MGVLKWRERHGSRHSQSSDNVKGLQTSRDERTSSVPTPEAAGNGSRELLEETLKGPKPYPNIVLPTSGGFWIDGQDQNEYEPAATIGGACTWNNKIETDDTAKAYRRYYMGRVSHAFPFNFSKRNLDSLARTGQLPEYKRSLASLAKSGQLPEKLVQEKRMLDVLEQASDANSKAIQEQRNRVVEEIKNLAFNGLTKRQAASEPDFRDEFKSDLRSILDQFLEKFGTTYDPEKVELFLTNMADEVFENHGVVSLDHIRFLIETGYFQPEMREEDDVKPADGDSSPDDYIAKRFMASLARTDNMPFWYNSPRYVAKRYISSLLRQGRLPYGFQPTTESSTKKQDWTSQDGQKPKRSDATFQNSEEFIPVMQGSKSLQSIIDDLTQEPMQKRYLAGTSRILSGRLKNSGGTTSSRRQQQSRRKQTTG